MTTVEETKESFRYMSPPDPLFDPADAHHKHGTARYVRFHRAIARARGRADQFPCIDCGKQARDWSHRHDTDRVDVQNYDPRCRSCHIRQDNPQSGENNNSAKLTERDVVQIRALRSSGLTQRVIADMFGVNQTAISKIVRGERWNG